MKLSTICYLESKGKTLLLQRNKKENDMHEGKWVGIGGKFEENETPEECIKREFLEETGLNLKSPRMRGMIFFPKFFKNEDWIMFVFVCDNYDGDMIDSNEGTLKWIDNDKIAQLEMWDGDSIFLEWMKEDTFFSARMVYDNQKLKDYTVSKYKF